MSHPTPLRSALSATLVALFAASLASSVYADVVLASPFTDHAVLQREKPVPIWGKADAGEAVTVNFSGQTVSTTAGADGRWSVRLAALPANAEPAELVVKGHNTVTLSDIVVGEVWIASGQSNMGFAMDRGYDAAIDIAASARNPLVRQFKPASRVSDQPADTVPGKWVCAGPGSLPAFSAAGYYFALDLYRVLNVPVGLLHSSWGGTRIEAWMDGGTLKADPAFAFVAERWQKALADFPAAKVKFDKDLADWRAAKAAAEAAHKPFTTSQPRDPWGPGNQATPAGLYNAMVNPLVPYALRGAIWYQGESNASRSSEYRRLFPAMITGWRRQFDQGDFPFYWVQLANYKGNGLDKTEYADLRGVQTETLALPNTGQAVTIDIGNANDIHPRNKKDVGRRLARLALARTYGLPLVDSGPVLEKAVREGAGYRVSFTHVEKGLDCPLPALTGFEVAGADKVFHPASAVIDGAGVVVTCPEVAEPAALRYAWRNAPLAGLFNSEGLPAVPFRTDTW